MCEEIRDIVPTEMHCIQAILQELKGKVDLFMNDSIRPYSIRAWADHFRYIGEVGDGALGFLIRKDHKMMVLAGTNQLREEAPDIHSPTNARILARTIK